MEKTVYIDTYFFINFVMDLLSVMISGLISSVGVKIGRALSAAFFGAAFSCAVIVFSPDYYIYFPMAALALFIMTFIAVGKNKRYFVFTAFVLVSDLFFGGVVEAIYFAFDKTGQKTRITLSVFILLTVLGISLWTVWGKTLRRKMKTGLCFLTFHFDDKSISCYGLIDSGNLIRVTENDYPVILMKEDTALDLVGEFELNLMKHGLSAQKTFLIPTKSTGGEKELIGFMPDSVKIRQMWGKSHFRSLGPVVVAIDYSKGGFAGCPCLVPLAAI